MLLRFLTLYLVMNVSSFSFGFSQGSSLTRPSYPKMLSEWGVFVKKEEGIYLHEKAFPYDLANPLFTDYALKFRTISLPEGSSIQYQEDGTLKYPDGTVITKTFSYRKSSLAPSRETPEGLFKGLLNFMNELHLVETRVLFKKEGKWFALPYVWEKNGLDARLKVIGASFDFHIEEEPFFNENFTYFVPNKNQCISCHVKLHGEEEVFVPIGARSAKNLNRTSPFDETGLNQLEKMKALGLIEDLPPVESLRKLPSWEDESVPIQNRAKAYLDANCAHCHNPDGPGNTSGLFLSYENEDLTSYGFCKKPVASGNGSSGARYDISPGDPHDSILYLRMNSTDPSVMMPELGRSLVHKQAVALIFDWISGLERSCP